MEQFTEGENTREDIKNKLRQNFDGKIVRKDLTKKIKEPDQRLYQHIDQRLYHQLSGFAGYRYD